MFVCDRGSIESDDFESLDIMSIFMFYEISHFVCCCFVGSSQFEALKTTLCSKYNKKSIDELFDKGKADIEKTVIAEKLSDAQDYKDDKLVNVKLDEPTFFSCLYLLSTPRPSMYLWLPLLIIALWALMN